MVELKPCPFCGGEAFIEVIPPHKHIIATFVADYDGGAFAECMKCSCAISADNEQDAITRWNTRTPKEIAEGKKTISEFRELFIKRMTVDSDHNDRRKKDYNQAIFCKYTEDGEHEQVFCGTTMEMVLQCFDDAVKDWRRTFCDVENCTRR